MVEQALLNIDEMITREKHLSVINFDSMDNNCMQRNVVEVLRLRPNPAALDDELENSNGNGRCGSIDAVIAAEESFLAPKSTDTHGKNVTEFNTQESRLNNVLLLPVTDYESLPNICFLSPLPTSVEKILPEAENRQLEIVKTVLDSATFISVPNPVVATITEEQKEMESTRMKKIKSNEAKLDRIRYMKLNDFDLKKEFCILCRAAEQRLTSETFVRMRSR